jgi:flagellar hook-basal body complex protein FliE
MIGPVGTVHLRPSVGALDDPAAAGQGAGIPAAGNAASSFADAVGQAAANSVGTLEQAEQMSVRALKGDADTRQVVDAVMDAQQTLQAAIAIRDKIVSAYLEVSRMSI